MYRAYAPDGVGTYILIGEFAKLSDATAACAAVGDRVEQVSETGASVVYVHA